VALLAVIIAGAAIWGYTAIKTEANTAAREAVENSLKGIIRSHVSEEAIGARIKEEVERIAREQLQADQAMHYPEAFAQTSGIEGREVPGPVADEYPGEGPGKPK